MITTGAVYFAGKPGGRAFVCLIDNDQIPISTQQIGCYVILLRKVDRSDATRKACPNVSSQLIFGLFRADDLETLVEFAAHFILPLDSQCGGTEYQNPLDYPSHL